MPWHFKDILIPGTYEEIATATDRKDESLFLFPDCQDRFVWEGVFKVGPTRDLDRTVFVLDHKPPNAKEFIERLFDITRKISFRNWEASFYDDLSTCHCLCYSIDADLVIGKIDLPESKILSILKNIAAKEDLSLVVRREESEVKAKPSILA